MLKYIFPLSYNKKTPKKFFINLVLYILIYVVCGVIDIPYLQIIASVYVFAGAALLMINYYVKPENKDGDNK